MHKLEQIYEGKAKKVYKTDDPELYIVDYKDDGRWPDSGRIHGASHVRSRLFRIPEETHQPEHG